MALPLDPFLEQAHRTLWDTLQQALYSIRAQRAPLLDTNALAMARLGTDQGIAQHRLNAGLANTGLFNSGIRSVQTNRLGTSFDRQRQDAAFQLAQNLADLAGQRSQAFTSYNQGWGEAQLESARRQSQDPYAVLPHYGRKPPPGIPKLPNRRT
jgi:hypothetical protein